MKVINRVILALSTVFLSACSTQTVDFRTSYFAVPEVKQEQWHGEASVSMANPTKVTFISDRSSNPPGRNFAINEDEDLESIFLLDNIGIEFDLSLFSSLELYYTGGMQGLRWQFLNHGGGNGDWVASLQAGFGSFSVSRGTAGDDKATSDVSSTQFGISIGKKLENSTIYFSYLKNDHSVETNVDNSSGQFSYEDKGNHNIASVGLSFLFDKFLLGLEYNYVMAKWEPEEISLDEQEKNQDTLGIRLGFSW